MQVEQDRPIRVVIMGCGRIGSLAAAKLANLGHDVTIIDWNDAAFDRLPPSFRGKTVIGNALDIDILRDAGIKSADAFVAATSGDNRNIMASQIARQIFKVPRVVARIKDPIRAEIYSAIGIQVDCRTTENTRLIMDAIEAS